MTKKRALGRGLEALIPDSGLPIDIGAPGTSVLDVPVDQIGPNPQQPRQRIESESLQELAASIAQHGVIQPLIVSEGGGDPAAPSYTLIAGERRLEAARIAGLTTVPVIVKEATAQQMLELALIENIQRADLNPLEEAAAYQHLVEDFGLTQQAIADRVGRNRVSIANALRLLRLPDFCKDMLAGGQISEGHARALLALGDDEDTLREALKTVIRQQLNVRQTEELVRRLRAAPASPKATRTVAPETRAIERAFARALRTKVRLSRSKRGGRLTIHFYSDEELQHLYDILVERSQSDT
ncbi:MAG: ParB/RepB/Spo0J family partition protein [Anaerolineae bacterium]|nr:ParB/RepB/Spo0J family partition protein [Anaerolineae bacterium]